MSTPAAPLTEAPELEGWDHVVSGKVRELYVPAGTDPQAAQEVLVVATDRISAYDHSLQPGIPDKGRLLTGISVFWFSARRSVRITCLLDRRARAVAGRALLPRPDMVLECIARGYLTGSGLADYRAGGSVGGHLSPAGLVRPRAWTRRCSPCRRRPVRASATRTSPSHRPRTRWAPS